MTTRSTKGVYLHIDRRVYNTFKGKVYRRGKYITDALNESMLLWMRFGQMIEKVRAAGDQEKSKELNARIVEILMLEEELEKERLAAEKKKVRSNFQAHIK